MPSPNIAVVGSETSPLTIANALGRRDERLKHAASPDTTLVTSVVLAARIDYKLSQPAVAGCPTPAACFSGSSLTV
jgi:hypothetical protein